MPVLEDIEEECTDELQGCCGQLLATNWERHVGAYTFLRGPLYITFMGTMGQRGSKGIWILDMGKGSAQRFRTHIKRQVTLSLTFLLLF